ncbi:MAG: hypothetical protein AAB542_01100 [Patescibacteria group bacterium]
MTETTARFNPETGKPNPISQREFHLMDRKEKRTFFVSLSGDEKKMFQAAIMVAVEALPLKVRREQQQMLVAKLEKRNSASMGDKVEILLEKVRLKQLMLPEKKPIFFRKLRSREFPWPKWMKEAKSPYLISSL